MMDGKLVPKGHAKQRPEKARVNVIDQGIAAVLKLRKDFFSKLSRIDDFFIVDMGRDEFSESAM